MCEKIHGGRQQQCVSYNKKRQEKTAWSFTQMIFQDITYHQEGQRQLTNDSTLTARKLLSTVSVRSVP